ncbi:MAG: biotin-dependent carboxyltransferase family protein [Chloroflexota bacterium]|nr:biotin-dependent carboxyltransferase family protein [Chloroflexota bacterium]
MTTLRVLAPGLRSTIQDAGRFGHLRDGVPPSGPADALSFEAAQRLVGNGASDAAIEIVGLPFRCALDAPRLVAATGPNVRVRARGSVAGSTSVFARAGEEIAVEGDARFAYLAVSGGFALDERLGSRSTYLAAGIGPLPRPLAAGDELTVGAARWGADHAGGRIVPRARDGRIRVTRGPHADRFTDAGAFFAATYRVSERSDRMGTRLEGPRLETTGEEILSIGVLAGAVQVPHGGEPIALLADHQTTGGYPIVAVVIRADVGLLAQAWPGEEVSFYEVRVDEAVRAIRDERRRLEAMVR